MARCAVYSRNHGRFQAIVTGYMTWTERESSLKDHVRLNVKHQTKENAPGQTAAQVKSE